MDDAGEADTSLAHFVADFLVVEVAAGDAAFDLDCVVPDAFDLDLEDDAQISPLVLMAAGHHSCYHRRQMSFIFIVIAGSCERLFKNFFSIFT